MLGVRPDSTTFTVYQNNTCWNSAAAAFAGTACAQRELQLVTTPPPMPPRPRASVNPSSSASLKCNVTSKFTYYCPIERRLIYTLGEGIPEASDGFCYISRELAQRETECSAEMIVEDNADGSPCFNPDRTDAYRFYCPDKYYLPIRPPPPPAGEGTELSLESGYACFATPELVRQHTVCGITPGTPLAEFGFGDFTGDVREDGPCTQAAFRFFCNVARAPSYSPEASGFCYESDARARDFCPGAEILQDHSGLGGAGPCGAASGGPVLEEYARVYTWYCPLPWAAEAPQPRFTAYDCARFGEDQQICPKWFDYENFGLGFDTRFFRCGSRGRRSVLNAPGDLPPARETFCRVLPKPEFYFAVAVPVIAAIVLYALFANVSFRWCPCFYMLRPTVTARSPYKKDEEAPKVKTGAALVAEGKKQREGQKTPLLQTPRNQESPAKE